MSSTKADRYSIEMCVSTFSFLFFLLPFECFDFLSFFLLFKYSKSKTQGKRASAWNRNQKEGRIKKEHFNIQLVSILRLLILILLCLFFSSVIFVSVQKVRCTLECIIYPISSEMWKWKWKRKWFQTDDLKKGRQQLFSVCVCMLSGTKKKKHRTTATND